MRTDPAAAQEFHTAEVASAFEQCSEAAVALLVQHRAEAEEPGLL